MKLIRMRVASTNAILPGTLQISRVPNQVYDAYIRRGDGEPVCGAERPEQLAALATAAAALGVTLHVPASAPADTAADVQEAARLYGAHFTTAHDPTP